MGKKIIHLLIFACSLLSVSCKKNSQHIPSATPAINILNAVITVPGSERRGFRSTDSTLITKKVESYGIRGSDSVIIIRAADPVGVITLNLVNISSPGTYFFKPGSHSRYSHCEYFELAPNSDYPVHFSTLHTSDSGNPIGTFTINKINAIEIEGTFSATMGYLDDINARIESGAFKGKFVN